ncbi:hypothetical protein Ddc_02872 [Ditylenchus destructor]|nr:hypothetical protein Ddc_02872 [Ditylenchus destructor]
MAYNEKYKHGWNVTRNDAVANDKQPVRFVRDPNHFRNNRIPRGHYHDENNYTIPTNGVFQGARRTPQLIPSSAPRSSNAAYPYNYPQSPNRPYASASTFGPYTSTCGPFFRPNLYQEAVRSPNKEIPRRNLLGMHHGPYENTKLSNGLRSHEELNPGSVFPNDYITHQDNSSYSHTSWRPPPINAPKFTCIPSRLFVENDMDCSPPASRMCEDPSSPKRKRIEHTEMENENEIMIIATVSQMDVEARNYNRDVTPVRKSTKVDQETQTEGPRNPTKSRQRLVNRGTLTDAQLQKPCLIDCASQTVGKFVSLQASDPCKIADLTDILGRLKVANVAVGVPKSGSLTLSNGSANPKETRKPASKPAFETSHSREKKRQVRFSMNNLP